MQTKLAGHLPLHDLIKSTIDGARTKLAAAEGKDEKVKKLIDYEKKEHGHIPSPKEEKEEKDKKASAMIDFSNPDEIEKLASALDTVAEKIASGAFMGGETRQGGETLATGTPVAGKQSAKKDSSKAHNVPMATGLEHASDGAGHNNVPTDEKKTPGGKGAKYPAKGVLKTAASEEMKAKLEAKKDGKSEEKKETEKKEEAEKKASADSVDFILGKVAEATQGGMVLSDDKASAPVPSNPGRQMIASNAAPKAATKREAKAPQKKALSEVLTEPAMSAAHDSKVNENLRNASKGGVKIAAAVAKTYLAKIAEEGCTCSGKGECKYCKMKAAAKKMEKK
jgi:hypothetical protein